MFDTYEIVREVRFSSLTFGFHLRSEGLTRHFHPMGLELEGSEDGFIVRKSDLVITMRSPNWLVSRTQKRIW
jgi:hypothetical protein